MDFRIERRISPHINKYEEKALEKAFEFAKDVHKEFGNFTRAVVLFGATARKEKNQVGDIDILVVVDDTAIQMTPELIEAYRVIVAKIVTRISPQLHIITLKFTSFWEYARVADPVVVNILRDGVALIDSGFIEPLQALLRQGRIRPTRESVITYFSRAPVTLRNSRWHLLQATVDLYWSVIDAAHAALMHHHEVPPSPKHLSELFAERFVKTGMLEKKYAERVGKFYDLMKKIEHREIRNITGPEFERYYKEAEEFVNKIEVFIRMKKVK
ncbi:hypothetical protein J4460_08085 [Candidatus Woesearchaeota archaeon]|nr:MAG: DNA polymerase beta protein [archaeon GW2011_AR4]MBS3130598.1 hypothetical protein [Candidatus Woesearchaeota archaeon]HIH39052.1 hypothetical protein [Candidatus Woesearchaeota archaeon]HIH48257.1 hypothetical protein [Candidatus Woesearchaeota archaeon]HIJ03819.1 hypothetical protein [Candidatus Woesearchaeota archaeon]